LKRTELGSPSRREPRDSYIDFSYSIGHVDYLNVPSEPLPASLPDLLKSRESRREFSPLDKESLSALLWHSVATKLLYKDAAWGIVEKRNYPSPGPTFPVDILTAQGEGGFSHIHLYDNRAHALESVEGCNVEAKDHLYAAVEAVLPMNGATYLIYAAQFGRTTAKYVDGESLVWREAGVLDATFYLVAEALGLSACSIGITGEPWVSGMLNSGGKVLGVGGMLVGQRKKPI